MTTRTDKKKAMVAKRLEGYGFNLKEVPPAVWRLHVHPTSMQRVLASRDFLVQVHRDRSGYTRLSICRTTPGTDRTFKDGISWDDLQRLKNEAGFADKWAVECFPPTDDLVNVANMRHLWILVGEPGFGWHDKEIVK